MEEYIPMETLSGRQMSCQIGTKAYWQEVQKKYLHGKFRKNVAAELGSVIILENDICLIVKDTVALELVYFIGIMKAGKVPVICGGYPDNEELDTIKSIEVPHGAVMGVMTSGTTGSSKVLFRTMESWADYFPVQNKLFPWVETLCCSHMVPCHLQEI